MTTNPRHAGPGRPVQIAVTADLHFGPRHPDGAAATHALADDLYRDPPDVFVIAGDVGAGDEFGRCLDLFADLPCAKALVPGNHDIWVRSDDPRGNSLDVYRRHLPAEAAARGFHYLDGGPLVLPELRLAVCGSINWYDYSWGVDRLREFTPDWADRLRTKRFTRGRHNDANFVQWSLDDAGFTQQAVEALDDHLAEALRQVPAALLVTHHPPFRRLNYPKPDPPDLDALMWEAFSGNADLEDVLAKYAGRVPLAFCGHTHFAREASFGPTRGYNVGGDYGFKRLLRVDWPAGAVRPVEYHATGEMAGL
jgi:3',5'-cyclic AMP phosphodiesterase CpdA